MKYVLAMLATGFVLPAYAGSSVVPDAEPTAMIVQAPTSAAGSFYGALSGLGAMPDAPFTQLDSIVPAPTGDLSLDNAFGLSGALGYDYGNGFRVEVEILRFGGDTDTLSFDGSAAFATDGTYDLTAGMLNGWYTFGNGSVRPFVGGGFGLMHADVDMTVPGAPPGGLAISGSSNAFAWQVGGGVEIPVTDRMSVLVSYRYLEAGGFDLVDSNSDSIEADLSAHVVTVGAMFRF